MKFLRALGCNSLNNPDALFAGQGYDKFCMASLGGLLLIFCIQSQF